MLFVLKLNEFVPRRSYRLEKLRLMTELSSYVARSAFSIEQFEGLAPGLTAKGRVDQSHTLGSGHVEFTFAPVPSTRAIYIAAKHLSHKDLRELI